MSRSVKPTWFCDIDGVLAPIGGQFGRGPYEIIPGNGWQGAVAIDAPWFAAFRGFLAKGLVDFVWCTNWEEDAQFHFAPKTGMGWYPLAAAPVREGWWKAQAVREHVEAARGPFIWTDDEIDAIGGVGKPDDVTDLRERTDGLVISTDPRGGLSFEQLSRIEEFARRFR
jgi:hypothetical protein